MHSEVLNSTTGSFSFLKLVRFHQIKRVCGAKRESTRHASQGRPTGMERSAKNGFAIHRAGVRRPSSSETTIFRQIFAPTSLTRSAVFSCFSLTMVEMQCHCFRMQAFGHIEYASPWKHLALRGYERQYWKKQTTVGRDSHASQPTIRHQ